MSRIARTVATTVSLMVTLAALAVLLKASAANAGATPEQKCEKGRYDAAAKYTACQQKAMGAFYGGGKPERLEEALGKCTVKYTATWPKLQKKASGTGVTCDGVRFVDNGNGTVTDRLTGLQWEQKTDDATIHDRDDRYEWSTSGDGDSTDADGTVFTSFLAALNSGGCFAGQCGWRLPTVVELQTILLAPYPCATTPCIDSVFGSTVASVYWSSTTDSWGQGFAWCIEFYYGSAGMGNKGVVSFYVRAVRGGL